VSLPFGDLCVVCSRKGPIFQPLVRNFRPTPARRKFPRGFFCVIVLVWAPFFWPELVKVGEDHHSTCSKGVASRSLTMCRFMKVGEIMSIFPFLPFLCADVDPCCRRVMTGREGAAAPVRSSSTSYSPPRRSHHAWQDQREQGK
jgi:hypothetical protein